MVHTKINTVVWGFEGKEGFNVIEFLKSNSPLDIVWWISDYDEDNNIYNYLQFKIKIEQINKSDFYVIYKYVYKNLGVFVNMFSRHYKDRSLRYHDYVDAFNIYLTHFWNLIKDKDITFILFSNIPHEGPDYILYLIAKKLGIKTLILYQSLFDYKFHFITDISDFGCFDKIPTLFKNEPVTINREIIEEYFYMKDVLPFDGKEPEDSEIKSFFTITKQLIRQFFKLKYDTSRFLNIVAGINYQRFINKSYQLAVSDEVFRNTLKKKFVYFPLAMQPELTTSAIGGVFNDQVLALDLLRNIIPDDWKIIVKENPKQTDFQRGNLFFKRVQSIEGLIISNPQVDTHLLIKHSQFVSVVTGTAGWEAIKGGKPTLVFGNPWYLSLPGVFHFERDFELAQLLNYRLIHSELESGLAVLLAKSGRGIVDFTYTSSLKKFDHKKNTIDVSNSIIEILKSEEVVWD